MGRSCVICHGASYGFTVALDEEGERVLVHASSCAAILSERRQKAAQVTPSGKPRRKTAGISMWTAGWEYGRYGPQHQLPCNCPRHREEAHKSEADDISWDRVLVDDPDIEYQ